MRRLIVVCALTLLLAVAAGCGNKTKQVTTTNGSGQVVTTTVPSVHFAKAKFILHGGLAYGAFHRYIYKPLKAGAFKRSAAGHVKAIAKAVAATAFIVHELKQMRRDALSDDRLRPIATKIDGIVPGIGSLAAAMKGGAFGAVDTLKSGFDDLVSNSKGAGANIPLDKAPAIP